MKFFTLSGNNINFFDLNKRNKINSISVLNHIYLIQLKNFCKANNGLLFVCGNKNIFLVDYQAYQLINM